MWIKKVDNHYEYIKCYVDDIIAFSKDPIKIMQQLQKIYKMKGVGKPQYYLGGDIVDTNEHWQKSNITSAFSAETYLVNALPKLAKSCNLKEFSRAKTLFS